MHRQAVCTIIFDDGPRSIGGCFNQCAVHFFRARGKRHAKHQAAQICIHQDGTVTVPPVQCDKAALSGTELCGTLFHITKDIHSLFRCLLCYLCRATMLHKPGKVITDTALAAFIAVFSGQNSILYHTAHAGHIDFTVTQHHMASRSTNDGKHISTFRDTGSGNGGMRINGSDTDCRTLFESCHLSHFSGESAGAGADCTNGGV